MSARARCAGVQTGRPTLARFLLPFLAAVLVVFAAGFLSAFFGGAMGASGWWEEEEGGWGMSARGAARRLPGRF